MIQCNSSIKVVKVNEKTLQELMLKSNDCYLDIQMTNTCNVHNINIIIDLRTV